ncbi:RNA polymerase sigma factor [Cohnella sp. GbtcB17]|uniref:RNA polymerase sigma factor n=1 Tax=Cohnella sp. GbtcB17 TaxID=2824762 RepID=UPI0020C60E6F|nr:sigma-70 family RNA polymerase sigma factor [Cohnella sp. GbtcB17]
MRMYRGSAAAAAVDGEEVDALNHDYLKHMTEGIDRDAVLEELMLTYGRDVWNYAFFMTGKRETAEDIAQDVFIKAYQSLHTLRGESGARAWLLKITRNTALDYFKSAWYRRIRLPVVLPTRESQMSAENEWLGSYRQREIWRTVMALPRKLRESLLLQAHHGLSMAEIAELLQVSEGTVKSRIHRARAAMNKRFERGQEDDEEGSGRA